jgi:hypothetical protein
MIDDEDRNLCGRNSAVECQLPKLKVASSNLVARSISSQDTRKGPMKDGFFIGPFLSLE